APARYRGLVRSFGPYIVFAAVFATITINFVTANSQTTHPVANKVQFQALPFELKDVRLLDSPFKKAMTLDGEYLLRLDPDRLLSGYRKEAGLTPKREVYGGWESQGLAGHSLGHYLTACSMMFAST